MNSINYRKEELLEKEHSMVWMNGRSSSFEQYRRFIGFNVSESLWSKLVSETSLSDLLELEGVSSQFEDWTISLISDNRLRSMVEDWWVTMNSSNEVRWCFLCFVLRFFTDFSNTQCLQCFVEGIVWFENPLYDSSKLHRTTSDWTVYIKWLRLMKNHQLRK